MDRYFDTKKEVARYVERDMLTELNETSTLTMTIQRVKSEGYFVRSVITESSESTGTPNVSKKRART